MTTTSDAPPILSSKRPVLVWVISIYCFMGAIGALLSLALTYSGAIPANEVQKQYFASQTWLDHGWIITNNALSLVAAIMLLLLRRYAFYLFSWSFVFSLLFMIYQAVARNWLAAFGGLGIVTALITCVIAIAIILYSRGLIKKGVLR